MEKLEEVVFARWGLRGRYPITDAGGPCLDESPEGVIRGEVGILGDWLFGHGTGGVAAMEQPSLNAVAFI